MATITVSNVTALYAALASAQPGDTVQLAAGNYSGLVLQNAFTGAGVNITSADPTNPAIITDLLVQNAQGLNFSHLVLDSDPAIPGVSATALSDPYPFRISTSSNIHFDAMNIHGSLDNDPSNDRSGPLIYQSTGVSITNSEFQQLSYGVVHSDSSALTFTNNYFHDVRSGGIVGSSSNVDIEYNYFTNFRPNPLDHPDAVHFYNETATDAPHNITVSNNIVLVGTGSPIQGIYFELPTATAAATTNVTIAGNLLVGTMYNGIALLGDPTYVSTGISVSGNTVASVGAMTARIWLGDTSGAIEANNSAGAFIFGSKNDVSFASSYTNTNLTQTNDATIAPVIDGGSSLLQQWLVQHPAYTVPAGSAFATAAPPAPPPPPPPPPPPAAPTGLSLDATTDSGLVGDGLTNIAQVKIDGVAPAGATVTLYDGATTVGSGTANATTGAFSIVASSALADGAHTLTATATLAGVSSVASSGLVVSVDTAAPTSPTSLRLDAATDSGVHGDGVTNIAQVKIDGVAQNGAAVTVYDGANVIGTGVANVTTGAFTITAASALANGAHALTAVATDAAGNVGPVSAALAVTVDTTPPAAPTSLHLDASTNGGVAQVKIDGLAERGAGVTLYDGAQVIGTGTADAATGTFSILPSSALTTGTHILTATATDVAGNTGPASSTFSATIVSANGSASVNVHSVSDVLGLTNTSNVSISGAASGAASVAIIQDGVKVGTSSAATGAWSFSEANVSNHAHTIALQATDATGNTTAGAGQILLGTTGNDTLVGGAGNDFIVGGRGVDILTGGGGADTFVYTSIADAPSPSNNAAMPGQKAGAVETITDFSNGVDKIDLTALGHLGFGGAASAPSAYHVDYFVSGGNTYIVGDVNGDGKTDFMIKLLGAHTMTAGDFLFG